MRIGHINHPLPAQVTKEPPQQVEIWSTRTVVSLPEGASLVATWCKS